jgi:hypothetical protein
MRRQPVPVCDNLSNNDPEVLTLMSKAMANTVARMAFDKSVVWAGENTGKTRAARAAKTRLRLPRARAARRPRVK